MTPKARARAAEAYAREVDTREAWEVAADAWAEAGDLKRATAAQMGDLRVRAPEQRPTYEAAMESQREFRKLRQTYEEVERAPLRERKENAAEFLRAMREEPDIVAERIGWLFNGSYGTAAKEQALRILRSPRMNRYAALTGEIATLEWRVSGQMVPAAWKKLTDEEKLALERAINAEIRDALFQRDASRRRATARAKRRGRMKRRTER